MIGCTYQGGRIMGDIFPPKWSELDIMLQLYLKKFLKERTNFRCLPDLRFAIPLLFKVER